MHTLRSLFIILVALTLSAPQSRAVAWAISFRQYDGSNVPRQVEFTPVANSLVGFSGTGQVTNITAGSGISISGNVISSTGGGGGGGVGITGGTVTNNSVVVGDASTNIIGTPVTINRTNGNIVTANGTFSGASATLNATVGSGINFPYLNFIMPVFGTSSLKLTMTGFVWESGHSTIPLQLKGPTIEFLKFDGSRYALLGGSTGEVQFTANVASTSPASGTLMVTGGVGVTGNINAGGTLSGSNLSGTNTGDQNTFADIVVGNATITPGSPNGRLTLVAGSNVTLTPSGTGNRTLTIDATSAGAGGTYTGTGNIVKDTGPTIADPTFTGNVTVGNLVVTDMAQTGPTVTSGTAITGNVINVAKVLNVLTVSADTTFTFSGTPASTGQWFSALITNSAGAQKTLTIPSSYSMARGIAVTTVALPASGYIHMTWMYTGSSYNLYGDALNLSLGIGVETALAANSNSATGFITGNGTADLTNKYVQARVLTLTSNATPTIDTRLYDAVNITNLATAITSMTTNLSGTPANFDQLFFRIKDDGTERAITWGSAFVARGATPPTTTTAGKVTSVLFIYNSVTSTWDCLSVATEA